MSLNDYQTDHLFLFMSEISSESQRAGAATGWGRSMGRAGLLSPQSGFVAIGTGGGNAKSENSGLWASRFDEFE